LQVQNLSKDYSNNATKQGVDFVNQLTIIQEFTVNQLTIIQEFTSTSTRLAYACKWIFFSKRKKNN